MKLVDLKEAQEVSSFGGKAASLSKGLRGGLPIPEGFALDTNFVSKLLSTDINAINKLKNFFAALDAPVAVRSSAIGEDAENASHAGQYLSKLNIKTFPQLMNAIIEVAESVKTDSAQAYRKTLGLNEFSRMAVVIQKLIFADSAGVMFSRNPITKRKEFVIEAAWGPGEAVVSGLVVPDYYRVQIDGSISEMKIGIKDRAFKIHDEGGVEEIVIEGLMVNKSVLTYENLQQLFELGTRCENVYGHDLDIEWAIKDEQLYLLQCRSITA